MQTLNFIKNKIFYYLFCLVPLVLILFYYLVGGNTDYPVVRAIYDNPLDGLIYRISAEYVNFIMITHVLVLAALLYLAY